jgi:hypothetical protein
MDTLNQDYNQPIPLQYPLQAPPPIHLSNKGKLRHESEWIRKRQAQNILNAHNFAHFLGVPLNEYSTILLKDTIQQSSTTAYKRIMAKYGSWVAYKRKTGIIDCPPIYIFTHENPRDNPHVNICFHIPPAIYDDFKLKLPRWIEAVQGKLDCDTLKTQPIKKGDDTYVTKYIIKGIEPEYIDHFGLRRLHDEKGPQGTIYGQRAGFSRSLGPTAIDKADFHPMRYYHWRKHNSPDDE